MLTGYKTLIFAILTALVPVLSMTESINLVPPEYLNFYLIAVSIVTALLRLVTTTPVGRK